MIWTYDFFMIWIWRFLGLGFSFDFLMIFLWQLHGIVWFSYGFLMFFPLLFRVFLILGCFLRLCYEFIMICLMIFSRILMNSQGIFHDFLLVSP